MELYPEEYYSDNSEFDEYLDYLDVDERQLYDISSLKSTTSTNSFSKYRLGKKGMSTQGYSLEIVAYRTHKDLDVLVDDDALVEGCTYRAFRKGSIRHPYFKHSKVMPKVDKTGETLVTLDGCTVVIEAFRELNDIDICVDGLYRLYRQSYLDFNEHTAFKTRIKAVANRPQIQSLDRLGEENISTKGFKMKIVAYRGCSDVDILMDDKILVTGKTYDSFKKGTIGNPESPSRPKFKDRTGVKGISTKGYSMEIVAYHNCANIDILVDGELVKGRSYKAFKMGHIGKPIKK